MTHLEKKHFCQRGRDRKIRNDNRDDVGYVDCVTVLSGLDVGWSQGKGGEKNVGTLSIF